MFTGIVQATAKVKSLRYSGRLLKLEIDSREASRDLNIGDSIAVNGVCLTVTSKRRASFTADVSPETLTVSMLGVLKIGDVVNIEKALRLNDRLGGHLVTGHVDGIGTVKSIYKTGESTKITILLPSALRSSFVLKGSVCLDGVSLTVSEIGRDSVSVAVIPHTLKATSLGAKRAGDKLNIETDIIGKYIDKHFKSKHADNQYPDRLVRAASGIFGWSGGVSACN